jgi:hypothetical protein
MNRTDNLRDIAKQFGIVALAKHIVSEGSSCSITEHEFTDLIAAHARTEKRAGETDAAAFARVFCAPENAELRRAHAITKSAAQMDGQPTQVGGDIAYVNEASEAYEKLQKLAAEMRLQSPTLSPAQAFAKVFEAPENRELAAKAHRRPQATTNYAFPR